jgi:hypothetical protein
VLVVDFDVVWVGYNDSLTITVTTPL